MSHKTIRRFEEEKEWLNTTYFECRRKGEGDLILKI